MEEMGSMMNWRNIPNREFASGGKGGGRGMTVGAAGAYCRRLEWMNLSFLPFVVLCPRFGGDAAVSTYFLKMRRFFSRFIPSLLFHTANWAPSLWGTLASKAPKNMSEMLP